MKDKTEKAMEAMLMIRLRLINHAIARIIATPVVADATAGRTNPKVKSRAPPAVLKEG